MYIAITLRYEELDNRELFCVSKRFKDIFDALDITLIPIMQNTNLEKIVDLCDALILTGSPIHVNPSIYSESNESGCIDTYMGEDDLDCCLIKLFNERNKPILGICRGIQMLNVYFGGTLCQKVSNHEGIKHNIRIFDNSFLKNLYGNYKEVNSTHTQGIQNVAENFNVTALADDGIIECLEDHQIIGVQWHPEKMNDIDFFRNFINEYVYKNN